MLKTFLQIQSPGIGGCLMAVALLTIATDFATRTGVSDELLTAELADEGTEEFTKEGLAFFERQIRPILVERCYKCHSEKAKTVESDLYVDTRAGLLKGGDQGPAIEPGEPQKSLLLKAVKYELDDLKMPPDRRLDDPQIADLEKWIKMGAPDPRKPKPDPLPPAQPSGTIGNTP